MHGTFLFSFKREADWTGPQSRLLKALKKRWPCAGTYRFSWSGANGASARIVASEVLSARLTELAASYPSSKIITVSHSHGGNIAAWASTDATHPPTVAVYLSTPFIQVQRQSRKSAAWLRWFLGFLPFYFEIQLGLVAATFPAWQISKSIFRVPLNYYLFGAAVTAILMLLLVPKRIHATRDRLTKLSNVCERKSIKELAIFVVGDEAAAILSTTYFTQWAGLKLILAVYIAGAVISYILVLLKKVDQATASQGMAWVIVRCATALSMIVAWAMMTQGVVQGLIGLDSSVGITPSPIGNAEFVTVGWDKEAKRDNKEISLLSGDDSLAGTEFKKDKNRQFRHSEICAAQETIDAIIGWLDVQFKYQGTAGPWRRL